MTNARDRLRAAIDEAWRPGFYEVDERRIEEVDNVLSALNLTPSAALALMEGRATVVPNEPDDDMYKAMLTVTRDAGYGHVHDAAGGAVYRAALAASPFRSDSDD